MMLLTPRLTHCEGGRPGNSRGATGAFLRCGNPWGTVGRRTGRVGRGARHRGADLWPCPEDAVSDHLAHETGSPCTHGHLCPHMCRVRPGAGLTLPRLPLGLPILPAKSPSPINPLPTFSSPVPVSSYSQQRRTRWKKKKRFFLISSAPSPKAKKDLLFFFGIGNCSLSDSHKDYRATTQEKLKKNSLRPPGQLEVPWLSIRLSGHSPPTPSYPLPPSSPRLPWPSHPGRTCIQHTCSQSCGSTEIPLPGKGIQIGTFRSQMENKSLLFNRTVKDSFIFNTLGSRLSIRSFINVKMI